MHYTKFPDQIMARCLRGIQDFQQQHDGKDPSTLHFPSEFAEEIDGFTPADALGDDVARKILVEGARAITRAKLSNVELAIVWDANEFKVSGQESNNMDRLRTALKAGKRIEIQRNTGDTSATLSVAQENARRAAEANARGERVACIIDGNGNREFKCSVGVREASELLSAGAVEG